MGIGVWGDQRGKRSNVWNCPHRGGAGRSTRPEGRGREDADLLAVVVDGGAAAARTQGPSFYFVIVCKPLIRILANQLAAYTNNGCPRHEEHLPR